MENWITIPGFDNYEVSDLGRVRSKLFVVVRKNGRVYHHPGKIITQSPERDGYMRVSLYVGKKCFVNKVHTLVYESFVEPVESPYVVDHINNDKLDNRLVNLQKLHGRENVAKDRWRYRKEKDLPTGVYRHRDSFIAAISINKELYYLGSFETLEEAKQEYDKALKGQYQGSLPSIKRIRHSVVDGFKVCSCCGKRLPLENYYISKGRVQGKCKDCFKKARKQSYSKSKLSMKSDSETATNPK